MSTPLPEAFAAILRSDATAALADLMVIATAHLDLFAWAAKALAEPAEPPAPSKPRSNGAVRHETKARKPRAAYHARRREERDRDDQALLEAMRSAPDASIGDWAEAVGKSRTSTVSALGRLRDAGLAESIEGKWKPTEEPAPHEPAPQWIAPLSATVGRRQRAHA